MHDRVQLRASLLVAEHALTELHSVEGAVGVQDAPAELLDDRRECRRSRFDDATRELVGVDVHCSMLVQAARAKLNAIVHPAVRELSSRLFAKAEAENPDAVVVYDVPLLVEASVDHPFDLVVVTNAPRRTQVQRLVEERGLDPTQAEARVAAQVDNTTRLAIADVVIDTDGTVAHTMSQTDALWRRIVEERARR